MFKFLLKFILSKVKFLFRLKFKLQNTYNKKKALQLAFENFILQTKFESFYLKLNLFKSSLSLKTNLEKNYIGHFKNS